MSLSAMEEWEDMEEDMEENTVGIMVIVGIMAKVAIIMVGMIITMKREVTMEVMNTGNMNMNIMAMTKVVITMNTSMDTNMSMSMSINMNMNLVVTNIWDMVVVDMVEADGDSGIPCKLPIQERKLVY